MHLRKLNLLNFRNYENLNLDLSNGINIIYGDNAQGKTNLLESIYFLALTKSHRSLNDDNLIKNNEKICQLSCDCIINDNDIKLGIELSNSSKKVKVDNEIIKNISDYVSNLKVIIFFPEDLELIKSSPDVRRRYINIQISQLDKNYFKILSDYNKLLKIRNELLKQYIKNNYFNKEYFDIITNYLIDKSVSIYIMRKKYIDKINLYANKIFKDISGFDNFSILYKPNINIDKYEKERIKDILINKYNELLDVEKRTGTTLVGPHRDDFEFILSGENLKKYGSQGQQRIAVLALKLSEIEIFKHYHNDNPILLLDDVFSELDDTKKNSLLNYINGEIQTIITTTDLSNLDSKILENAKLIKIINGKIEEDK